MGQEKVEKKALTKVRLDKWLWAARFYKTRSQAATAVKGGKVDMDGMRAKSSTQVKIGCDLEVRKGPYRFELRVAALGEKRRNAEYAQTLYSETAESSKRREQTSARIASERAARPHGWTGGRPTKKQRRDLENFRRLYQSPEDIDDDDFSDFDNVDDADLANPEPWAVVATESTDKS